MKEKNCIRDVTLFLYVPPRLEEGMPEDYIHYADNSELGKTAEIFLIHRQRYGNIGATHRPPYQTLSFLGEEGEALRDLEDKAFGHLLRSQLGICPEDMEVWKRTNIRVEQQISAPNQVYGATNTGEIYDCKIKRYYLAQFNGPKSKIKLAKDIDSALWVPKDELSEHCERKELEGLQQILEIYCID